MKIVDVNQIHEIDKFTIEHESISSIDPMELAEAVPHISTSSI